MGERIAHRVEVVTFEHVLSTWCNACGAVKEPYQLHRITLEGGFGNRFPGDMQRFRFHVCEDCLKAWTLTFKDQDFEVGLDKIHQALHTETGEILFIFSGWAVLAVGPNDNLSPNEGLLQELTESFHDIRPGVWEHHKGGYYEVLGLVARSDTLEVLVYYRALCGDSKLFVRPASMWLDEVKPDVTRFRRLPV